VNRLTALLVSVAGVLVVAAPAWGTQPPRAADLEAELVCPVCGTTLDQSDAPIALRMKAYIRRRIAAGDSAQQIKNALVSQFGPSVLASPPGGGFGLLAWLTPLSLLIVGAVVIGALIRAWSRRRAPPLETRLDPELERRVDEELARFET